jgi:hypothetical protein
MAIRRLLITTVTTLLLVLPAGVVVAQDESPAPDPLVALADSPFAGIFPTELGGLPWDELTVAVGQESFSDSDAEEAARLAALIEGLGATIDDVTTVNASRSSEDFSEFTFLVAFRVAGVDADLLLEAFAPVFAESLEEPVQEDGQVAGKDVVTVYDAASEAFFFGEVQPIHMYATGDTLWMISAAEPLVIEAFDGLP